MIALELGPDTLEREQGPVLVKREPHHMLFLVSGFGSGAYSAKLFAGTRYRCSGLSEGTLTIAIAEGH
jgi:hypothetical protein